MCTNSSSNFRQPNFRPSTKCGLSDRGAAPGHRKVVEAGTNCTFAASFALKLGAARARPPELTRSSRPSLGLDSDGSKTARRRAGRRRKHTYTVALAYYTVRVKKFQSSLVVKMCGPPSGPPRARARPRAGPAGPARALTLGASQASLVRVSVLQPGRLGQPGREPGGPPAARGRRRGAGVTPFTTS
jgi:hypothetical protein